MGRPCPSRRIGDPPSGMGDRGPVRELPLVNRAVGGFTPYPEGVWVAKEPGNPVVGQVAQERGNPEEGHGGDRLATCPTGESV